MPQKKKLATTLAEALADGGSGWRRLWLAEVLTCGDFDWRSLWLSGILDVEGSGYRRFVAGAGSDWRKGHIATEKNASEKNATTVHLHLLPKVSQEFLAKQIISDFDKS